MNRLLLLPVVLTITLGTSTVHAASPRQGQQVPVVATWFSTLRPVSGEREVLSIEFGRDNHSIAGGRFSATIRYGTHFMHLRGGTTNRHGIAAVAFTVPHGLKGTSLRATTTVVFKGRHYLGSNQVTVVR